MRRASGSGERGCAIDIRTILVPVDFSDHARAALEEATALAESAGAAIHLLHCYSIRPEVVDLYGTTLPEGLDRDLRQATLRRLEEWAEPVRARGVSVEVHAEARLPGEQIVATAEALGADLIAMGTRGSTGLQHVLLGSVAERTLRRAPCPVWVTRRRETA